MKKSFITWRVGFTRLPGKEEVRQVAALLAPITRVEKPDDYGLLVREYGLHDFLFIGPESERMAGELALDVLARAHSLGRGWSITWPVAIRSLEKGMTEEEVRMSAMPEGMEGFCGAVNISFPFVKMKLPDIESVSFSVGFSEEEKAPQAPKPPPPPREEPPLPPPGPAALEIISALGRLLVNYGRTRWKWEIKEAAEQALALGFKPDGEEYGELYFKGADSTRLRIAIEEDRVLWVEFILADFKNPHLLEEADFSRKQDEFEALFEQAVNYARALLGTPLFKGASGEKGFPKDQWADFAAVWAEGEGRLMIQQKHNDRELPLELCLVFAP